MTWERALEADARLAAKNAVLIRAALRQSFDPERAFIGYQNTQPDKSLTLPQQRSRARAWAIMNVRPNLEPLREVLFRIWAEAYALGDTAAREAIEEAKQLQKADTEATVDWSKWKPGDAASAILLKPPRAFQQLLQAAGITLKGFSDTTLTDIGNAIGEAIELGLDAKRSAKNILNHVANPARALSIAITEQNRAISAATINRYQAVGLQEMEWLVFEPCDICAKNANQKVRIGAPFPSGDTQPPAHPHCRCALAPVIPGLDDPANTAGLITPPPVVETGVAPVREALGIKAIYPERWTPITPDDYIARTNYRNAVRQQIDNPDSTVFRPDTAWENTMRKQLDKIVIYAKEEHTIMVLPSAITKGMTPDKIETFGKYFDEVYAKVPAWHKTNNRGEAFYYELVISNEARGTTLAFTRLNSSYIYFNEDYLAKEMFTPTGTEGNWKMPAGSLTNPVKYTIAHEIGHTIDSIFNTERSTFSSKTRRKYPGQLSEYGKEKPEEAYAEAFADWLLNPNPSEFTMAYAEHYRWGNPSMPADYVIKPGGIRW